MNENECRRCHSTATAATTLNAPEGTERVRCAVCGRTWTRRIEALGVGVERSLRELPHPSTLWYSGIEA